MRNKNKTAAPVNIGKEYRLNKWRNERRRNEAEFPRRRQPFVPKVNLREDQVGITEYVSSAPGFTGVVKSRYSDFHVNEIDLSGTVQQLNNLDIPKPPREPEVMTGSEVDAAQIELAAVLTDAVWAKMAALASGSREAASGEPIEIEVSQLTKEQRTKIHKIVKKVYDGMLSSATISGATAVETAPMDTAEVALEGAVAENAPVTAAAVDENVPETAVAAEKAPETAVAAAEASEELPKQTIIKISKILNRARPERQGWAFPGEYMSFLVHKENMDTSEVAAIMAERLRIRPSAVNYCGTKDKRAKTTQQFCIKRRDPRQILGAIKFMRNVHVGNFKVTNEVLKLGDLKGNRFRIALRHVSGNQSEIEQALTDMRDRGFINYFGLQRFGNCAAIPTHKIGVALLKSDYRLACELILKPREHDFEFMSKIRECWWTKRNSAEAAAMFRSGDFIEKKLLEGLAQYGENDYSAALRKIPRNMLLLYPHAFQSLIFNCVASRRIKEFGIKLIAGDLVYRNKDELDTGEELAAAGIKEEPEVEEEQESDTEEEEATISKVKAKKGATEQPKEGDSIFKRKVKALTAEDIASGEYTIFDIVLPLPGYDITYPANEVASWYEKMLQEHDLSSEKLRHPVKTLAMAGAYRKLLMQPTKMSWEFRNYDNAESTLIESDWEVLRPLMKRSERGTVAEPKKEESKTDEQKPKEQEKPLGDEKPMDEDKPMEEVKSKVEEKPKEQENAKKEEKPEEKQKPAEGKLKALILDFCLPPSAYATMALRELLKCDTSAASQTQLEKGEKQKVVDKAEKLKAGSAESKKKSAAVVEKRKATLDSAAEEKPTVELATTSAEAVAAKKQKSSDAEEEDEKAAK